MVRVASSRLSRRSRISMPNMPMMRSSPSSRKVSMPGKYSCSPPKSPTLVHTSSGGAATVTSTEPSAIRCLLAPRPGPHAGAAGTVLPATNRRPDRRQGGVAMETRTIGSLKVSVVGLGCNNFGMRIGRKETDAVVGAALDTGITFFDTADIYGGTKSETYLGAALGSRRDEIVLATKFGGAYEDHEGGGSPSYVRTAVEDSLTRLGTDRLDLYQLHVPDSKTPVAETISALAELVGEGKSREFGCSNFTVEMLEEAA